MSYTKTNVQRVESIDGLHLLRDALECQQFGFTVIDVEDGRNGRAHDHAGENHEEVYFVASGVAELEFEDETVPLEEGDAIRVDPEEWRQLNLFGDSQVIVVGSP